MIDALLWFDRVWRRLQLWLFYRWYPAFRGPWAPEWVGTMYVEQAWRFADDLGIDEAIGRDLVWYHGLDCPRRMCFCAEMITEEKTTP